MRNIHWLPRTERTLRRTWSASVWNAEPVVGRGQRAGDGVAGAVGLLHGQEVVNGLLEPALEQMLVAFEGNQGALGVGVSA